MKMTKAHIKTLVRLDAEVEIQVQRVYTSTLRNDVPFWTCLKMADPAVREAYDKAVAARDGFRVTMVDEGRAWRDDGGRFIPNN